MKYDKEFFEYFEAKFKEYISRKNGWGKNEVMDQFNAALTQSLMECLSRTEKVTKNE